MAVERAFSATARGVGFRDFARQVEQHVQPMVTPALAQDYYTISGAEYTSATRAFALGYVAGLQLPQVDGTWGLESSAIPLNIYNVMGSLLTENLMALELQRYANEDDYNNDVIAERFITKWGYGHVNLRFSKGIPTQEGSVYAIWYGAWPDTATFTIRLGLLGIASELTTAWV